jgi:hypothetical protein
MLTPIVLTSYGNHDTAQQILDTIAPVLHLEWLELDRTTGKTRIRIEAPADEAREIVCRALDAAAPDWYECLRLPRPQACVPRSDRRTGSTPGDPQGD